MKTLYDNIKESLLDDEDIQLDKLDKVAEYSKWFNGLSNKDTYKKYFTDLWTEINQKCDCVKKSKMDSSKNYIVFQTQEYPCRDKIAMATTSILKLFAGDGKRRFKEYEIKCFPNSDGTVGVLWSYISKGVRPIVVILPRKSKSNNFIGRQIYELTDEYLFLFKIMEDIYEKLK